MSAATDQEQIDTPWDTTPQLLAWAAATFGDQEALVDDSVEAGAIRLTYRELEARARSVARALIASGIEPGDRVAIWAPNIWEWPVTLLGLHMAGAVLVPLNTRYKGTEAAFILNRSRARALFTVEGFLGNNYVSMLEGNELPSLERIVVLRGDVTGSAESCEAFMAADSPERSEELNAELDARIAALTGEDLSDLLFTSGTTGAPKGVMCTHGQTVRAFNAWATVVGLRSTDRYLIINPFFHAFGYKAGLVASLCKGATMVTAAVFDVPKAMATIATEKISMIPGPPTLYQTILGHPDFDPSALASLRLAVTGAAVVPVSLIEQMRDVLGFETVITGYGLTEACGIAAMCRHDDDPETIAMFSGRAIPGVEIAIVDDDGTAQSAMEPGEVVIRGYNVMLGYFEDPEQTAEAIDSDGWLHTGDIGVMNDRGYIKITDRKKDMFIVGGFNAYPAEIESLLLGHPGIAQAAVVGVPDERMGEVGYAFVVPTLGATLDPEEVRQWARTEMANYKAPAFIEVVSELPLNASGKVLKFELRDRALASIAAAGK
jgi:acyl-CoA synthetase (AMP-forming)/AMP-acid ligase II